MPMKTCSCGLDMRLKKQALICDHCDGTAVHVISSCPRCKALGLGRSTS